MRYRLAAISVALSLISWSSFAQTFVSDEAYSDNPMHGVGVAHNAYAGCAALHYQPGQGGSPIEALVRQCGYPTGGSEEDFIRRQNALLSSSLDAGDAPLAEGLRAYRAAFSDEQFAYFEDIDSIFASTTDAATADRLLKTLETQAIRGLGRSDQDLTVLGAISTARHSLELWTRNGDARGATTQRARWPKIFVADVRGFVIGTNTCTIICGVINGAAHSIVKAFDDPKP